MKSFFTHLYVLQMDLGTEEKLYLLLVDQFLCVCLSGVSSLAFKGLKLSCCHVTGDRGRCNSGSATVTSAGTAHYCSQCKCGSSTASIWLKLCSSSVQPGSMCVVELVSTHQAAPSWRNATVALAHFSLLTN